VLSTRGIFDTKREMRNRKNMSDRRFAGKVALVTGATSGIGQACAIAFATAGAKVACVGRKENALQDVSARIRALDSEALEINADLASADEL
jgi:2-deoxy-D-gluconate 3-dehydrogenase